MANDPSNHTTKKESSIKIPAAYYTLILPVTEILSFIGAAHFLLERKEWQAVTFFLLAALFLSLSVHICFHEFLHFYFKRNTPWFISYGFTLLAGMPFDGFRLHHINHHQHNNSPADFSTTWEIKDHHAKPKNIFLYAITWPLQLFKVMKFARSQAKQGLLSQKIQSNIRKQQFFVVGFFMILIITSPQLFLLYAALIYVGWIIVSIHNYGQHSQNQHPYNPNTQIHNRRNKIGHHEKNNTVAKTNTAISIYHRWYNIFFFNNGLHFEHHDQPEKSWRELFPSEEIKTMQQKQNSVK
jgi:fatty acid desaturase